MRWLEEGGTSMRIKWYAGAIISLCLCLLLLIPAAADGPEGESDRQSLRVGYVREEAYFYKNDNGEYRGYTPDLLYQVAMYGNFDLEIVEFPNYAEEDQALLDGRIDMETTVPKSPAWEAKFAFSDTPTSNIILSLAVNENDSRYEYGDPADLNNMRIAVVIDDAAFGHFQVWYQKNGLTPTLQFYADIDQALAAVQNGDADGIIINNEVAPGCRITLHFSNIFCYAMFNKDTPALKARFDRAISQLLLARPMYEQQLYYEHIVPVANNATTQTSRERNFLAEHNRFTVALQDYEPPFSYVDSAGKLQGILPSYYEKLGQEMGVTFTYKVYPTQAAAQEAVRQGQADIVGIYSDSLQSAVRL